MRGYSRDYYEIEPDFSERHGVYRILRDMNEDVRELKASQYETDRRLTRLESTTEEIKKDVTVLKKDVAVLQSDVSGLKEDMKEVRQDIKEIRQDMKDLHGTVKEIAGSLSGMQTRFNWWLVIAGVVIAALQFLKP